MGYILTILKYKLNNVPVYANLPQLKHMYMQQSINNQTI